jgi:hypothetical protein
MKNFTAIYSTESIKNIMYAFAAESLTSAELFCKEKFSASEITIVEDIDGHTFDVVFNDDSNSNNKGFACSLEDAVSYIARYNGSNESYFEDYKNGSVQVVCNQTGEVVYQESVK